MTLSLSSRPAGARAARPLVVLPFLLLAACTSSGRFSGQPAGGYGGPWSAPATAGRVAAAPPLDDYETAPPAGSSEVIASPLPPAAGAVPALPPPGAPPPLDSSLAGPGQAGGSTVATLGQPSATPSVGGGATGAPVSRTSITGGWSAREATGGSCKVTLSSSPALDLYRASTAGCANKDLQSVNAWDLRDGEVYLYSRGSVVARLKGGGGSYSGVIAKSGAPLTISR